MSTARIGSTAYPAPFSFHGWIGANKSALAPPVGNKLMLGAGTALQVMIVGGPNSRSDFHVEKGEEWFYMIKGDMLLNVVAGGVINPIVIREGESFLLPANTPHSPQRLPDTIGLVIERQRSTAELDGLRWYCRACSSMLVEQQFHCSDLGTQLKPLINGFNANTELHKCKQCGATDCLPVPIVLPTEPIHLKLPFLGSHPLPFALRDRVNQQKPGRTPLYSDQCEFQIYSCIGNGEGFPPRTVNSEVWFLQLAGSVTLECTTAGFAQTTYTLREGDTFLLPPLTTYMEQRAPGSIGVCLEIQSRSYPIKTGVI